MSTTFEPVAPKATPRTNKRSQNRAGPDAKLFTRLGWFAVRRRRMVLAGTAVFMVVAAVLGTGTFARLKSAGFQDPGAESTKAENTLKHSYGAGDSNVVALVTTRAGTVDRPDVIA